MTERTTRRILFPFSDTVVGGSYVSASILSAEIALEEGWDVVVCLPALGENSRLFEGSKARVRYMGVPEERLEEGRRLRLRRQWRLRSLLARRAMQVLREVRPDIVHINDDRTMLTWGVVARLLGIPVVWHVRQQEPTAFDPLLRSIANLEILIASSTSMRFEGQAPRRSLVIHNVTDVERYRPPSSRRNAKEALGLPVNAFVVGYVGRLHPDKRVEWAIRTTLALRHKYPELRLLIVGREARSDYRRTLERHAAGELGRSIYILGERKDIPEIMHAIDLLLVPSVAEPFGLVVIEAMASGVPVLGTKAGGLEEIIDDGVDGKLVDASSLESFEEAADELIADEQLRQRLATAGRIKVVHRFSLARLRREVITAYDHLLNSDSAVPGVRSHGRAARGGR